MGEELPDAFHLDQAERHQDALGFVDQNGSMAEVVVKASFNLVEQTRDGVQTNSRHGGRVVRCRLVPKPVVLTIPV